MRKLIDLLTMTHRPDQGVEPLPPADREDLSPYSPADVLRTLPPYPVVLVTTRSNVLAVNQIAYFTFVPLRLGVAIAHVRYSHALLQNEGEFVVNVPDASLIDAVRVCGSRSGRDGPKFRLAGLDTVPGEAVRAVRIVQCGAHIECQVEREIAFEERTVHRAHSSRVPTARPQLVLGTKGMLYVQFDVRGTARDAHSGAAPVLPSAAWRLVEALALLRTPDGRVAIPGFYDDARAPTEAELDALAGLPDMADMYKQAFGIERFVDDLTGLALRERQAFAPTSNIAGLLSGYTGEGVKTVLPASAMAKMDFRLVPDQEPQDIYAKLRAYLDAQGYTDVRTTALGMAEPVVTPIDHPFVRHIAEIATDFAGTPPTINPLIGGTLPLLGPLRRYVDVPGLSTPGNAGYWGSGEHAPNEHVRLSDLARAVRFNCHMFRALGEG